MRTSTQTIPVPCYICNCPGNTLVSDYDSAMIKGIPILHTDITLCLKNIRQQEGILLEKKKLH